jgi:hypothetical protein
LAERHTVLEIRLIQPLMAAGGKFSDMRHHCRAAKGCQAKSEKGYKQAFDCWYLIQK